MISFIYNILMTPNSDIVVLSNPNLYELATNKEWRLAFYIEWQQRQ